MERVIRWCGTAAIRALGPAAVEESVAAFTLCRMAGIGYYAERGSLGAPSRASCVSASGFRPLPDCRREALPLSQRSQTSNLTRHARLSGATLGRRLPERKHWNRQGPRVDLRSRPREWSVGYPREASTTTGWGRPARTKADCDGNGKPRFSAMAGPGKASPRRAGRFVWEDGHVRSSGC